LNLTAAIERLLAHDEVLVGVDFDGTLAPIVEHPDLAEPDPDALRLVREIARIPRFQVAIVSGRSLADLRSHLGEIEGATLVGEHGNDVEGAEVKPSPELEAARDLVDSLQKRFPDAVVEKKQRSVTFHTRKLDRDEAKDAAAAIRQWIQNKEDIALLEGKEVFELTTATGDKGDAIRDLAGERPLIYIGDDTTDETVFQRLGPNDVGVKVGEGPTAASHRTEDIAGVVTILSQIALASSR
jgi:trehalose 6-phosphate phosphatase